MEDAKEFFQKELEEKTKMAKENGYHSDIRDMATLYGILGDISRTQGKRRETKKYYRRQRALNNLMYELEQTSCYAPEIVIERLQKTLKKQEILDGIPFLSGIFQIMF